MRFNPKARVDQSQTEHRAPGRGGARTGRIGGGGTLTIGGLITAGVVYLIAQFAGVDVSGLLDDGAGDSEATVASQCRNGADAASSDQCKIDLITVSVQDYWTKTFEEQVRGGGGYEKIKTVTFSGHTSSGCGTAAADIGPFYCPNDQRVYLDVDFMDDMLTGDLGARGGDFALAYVVAHEYGHHVEDLLGYLGRMRTQQGERSDSVKIELMADCLAGMWAGDAEETEDAEGNRIIENLTRDDVSRAIDAARAVGDDRIQKQATGQVNPEAWTHGSSREREHWFNVGLKEGSIRACDTFAPGAL